MAQSSLDGELAAAALPTPPVPPRAESAPLDGVIDAEASPTGGAQPRDAVTDMEVSLAGGAQPIFASQAVPVGPSAATPSGEAADVPLRFAGADHAPASRPRPAHTDAAGRIDPPSVGIPAPAPKSTADADVAGRIDPSIVGTAAPAPGSTADADVAGRIDPSIVGIAAPAQESTEGQADRPPLAAFSSADPSPAAADAAGRIDPSSVGIPARAPGSTVDADVAGRIDPSIVGNSAPAPEVPSAQALRGTAAGAQASATDAATDAPASPTTPEAPSGAVAGPAPQPGASSHDHGQHRGHGQREDDPAAGVPGTLGQGSEHRATPAVPAADGQPATPAIPAHVAAATEAGLAAPSVAAAPSALPAVAAPAPTPVASSAPPAPPLAHVSLQRTVERIDELVRISTLRGGQARATLQLKPVELGTVDVQLRTTREGLVATISARDEAGLQALQQAGGELRRSLEDRGVTLHRLDVQLSQSPAGGNASQSGFGGAFAGEQQQPSRSRGASTTNSTDMTADAEDELLVATVTRAPAGALVDVQA